MSVESNPGLNWFCFTVLFDWSRKLAPPSQPIRCKLKPIAPWSLAFSRATGRLHAFTSSCHWLPLIISFTLIGRCDYFGFWFSTLNWKALYVLKADWQNLRCCTQMFRGNGPGSSRLRSSTWGFAFSKIQNNTFSKLCPPSKGNLLMGHFSERLTQNEIYFPNFHQYSLRNENYNASQGRI